MLFELLVSIIESVFEIIEDAGRRHDHASDAAGGKKLNSINGDAAAVFTRLKNMLVNPVLERPGNLLLNE